MLVSFVRLLFFRFFSDFRYCGDDPNIFMVEEEADGCANPIDEEHYLGPSSFLLTNRLNHLDINALLVGFLDTSSHRTSWSYGLVNNLIQYCRILVLQSCC